MPLSTYAELKASITDWANSTKITDSIAGDLVTLFEAKANRFFADKRLAIMLATNEAFIVDAEYEPAPADLLEVISLEVPSATRPYTITPSTSESIARMAYDKNQYARWGNDIYGTDTSPPKHFARVGTQLRFFPVPTTSYTTRLVYIQRIPALASGVNWLFLAHPDLYLWGALVEAEPYLDNDERVTTWQAKRDAAFAEILTAYPKSQNYTGLRTEIGWYRYPYR